MIRNERHSNSHNMTNPQVSAAKQVFESALAEVLDGNLSELARRLNVSPQAVQAWTVSGVIPARRVVRVCEALEDRVADYQLRPDIFRVPLEG